MRSETGSILSGYDNRRIGRTYNVRLSGRKTFLRGPDVGDSLIQQS